MFNENGYVVNDLKKAGLTYEEAKVYLFLNENPKKNEEELASALGFDHHKLKDVLASLKAKGLIQAADHDKYDVTPPSKALDLLINIKVKHMELELAELKRRLSVIKDVLESKYWESHYGIRDELILEPLDDLKSMEIRTAKLITEAQKEILIFTASFEWYTKIRELLLDSVKRGVEVKVLMRIVDEMSKKRAEELIQNGIKVKNTIEDWYPVRGTIVDKSKLVFLIWATEKKLSYYKPHYTENLGLIKVFIDAFEQRWERALDVKA